MKAADLQRKKEKRARTGQERRSFGVPGGKPGGGRVERQKPVSGDGRAKQLGNLSGDGQPERQRPERPLATIKRLCGFFRPHAWKLAAVAFSVILAAGARLVPPWITRYTVDSVLPAGRPELLWYAGGALLAASLLEGALVFLNRYAMEYLGQRVIFELRGKLYEHLSRLSFSYYDSVRTGDIMARITSDTEILRRFFGFAGVNLLTNLLVLAGVFFAMLSWDYRLALLYLGMVPFMYHAMKNYAFKVRPSWRVVRRRMAGLTEVVRETVVGMETVKLFNGEETAVEKFAAENDGYYNSHMEAARISAIWMPYAAFLLGLGTAVVIWYGGKLVIRGGLSLGTLIGFTGYIAMLTRPIRQTGRIVNLVIQAVTSAERIFATLDTEPEVKDTPGAYELPGVTGRVEYSGVEFSYNGKNRILRDVSFTADPGEIVAIVGPTGAGKSTLLHLLPRFYEPTAGRITIDGREIREVTVKSLRSKIGMVLQDTFLFAASVAENIAFGKPEATMEEIRWAAKTAQIDDYIESLPDGYDTLVGERGVRLSGGQKQRLAIARVLLTDPRILLLDEPTSSVDTETEERLRTALTEVIKGRTVIVVAHRLWTVRSADKIVVLQNGRIVETGTHEELLAKEGVYAGINRTQLQTTRGSGREHNAGRLRT